MLTVMKEFSFAAAHRLPQHTGQCKDIHGHTYTLQITLRGHPSEDQGMVMDFGDLKSIVQPIVDELDHSFLNTKLPTMSYPGVPHWDESKPPTAELMAIWIAILVHQILVTGGFEAKLHKVRLYESPTSYAEWKEG